MVEDSRFGDGRRLSLRDCVFRAPWRLGQQETSQRSLGNAKIFQNENFCRSAQLLVLPRLSLSPSGLRTRRCRCHCIAAPAPSAHPATERAPRSACHAVPLRTPPARERAPFEGLCVFSPGISPKFPFHTPFSRRRRTYALCQNSTQQAQTTMSRSAHLRVFGGSSGAAPRPREPPQRAQGLLPRPVGGFRPEFCLRKIFGPPAQQLLHFLSTFQGLGDRDHTFVAIVEHIVGDVWTS